MHEPIKHHSAPASHYDQEAKHYDLFNETRSEQINKLIQSILDKHDVKKVLDLTCGTGSQVFWLIENGFEVTGVDINPKMLKIAQHKARQKKLLLRFEQGDMRTSIVGKFEAVLTIFNSIGHLTKEDFGRTIQNISANLNPGGLYVFDIFNLDYLLNENNITKLTIDWQKKSVDGTAREIQYSTISQSGVLVSYDIYHEQVGGAEPKITTGFQTLQVYSAKQLKDLLNQNGFEVMLQSDVDGSALNPKKSERILTIAQKC